MRLFSSNHNSPFHDLLLLLLLLLHILCFGLLGFEENKFVEVIEQVFMAVQAQMYPENLRFQEYGLPEWKENGCGFYDCYQSVQQQQQFQMRNPNVLMDILPDFASNSLVPMAFSHFLGAQIEKQRQEIDRLIVLQNERLRVALQEHRQQQLAMLVRKVEGKVSNMLKQKEEEIARASRKTAELEDCLRRIEMENQTWQRIARENEAMVLALTNTLEQVGENICLSTAEDAGSCCDFSHAIDESDGEERRKREESRKMACKVCNSRNSCILILPCRHLCSCKSCEASLDSCPVCKSVKKASIEVYMF